MTTNEPAFPITEANGANRGMPGMSIRDYFAAKAMQVDYELAKKYSDPDWRISVALDAYKMADAMLEARSVE